MKDNITRSDIRKFLTEGFFDEEPQSTFDIMVTLSTFLHSLRQVPGVDPQELQQMIKLLDEHRQSLRRGHTYPHISMR
tara:strand:- start:36 stop:269 length:234 start_codon:yes stop_codon:yes gene_type:complete